jgi:hypothetical protein
VNDFFEDRRRREREGRERDQARYPVLAPKVAFGQASAAEQKEFDDLLDRLGKSTEIGDADAAVLREERDCQQAGVGLAEDEQALANTVKVFEQIKADWAEAERHFREQASDIEQQCNAVRQKLATKREALGQAAKLRSKHLALFGGVDPTVQKNAFCIFQGFRQPDPTIPAGTTVLRIESLMSHIVGDGWTVARLRNTHWICFTGQAEEEKVALLILAERIISARGTGLKFLYATDDRTKADGTLCLFIDANSTPLAARVELLQMPGQNDEEFGRLQKLYTKLQKAQAIDAKPTEAQAAAASKGYQEYFGC